MERSGCVEGADHQCLIDRTDSNIADHRRAWFCLGVGHIALPGAIRDNVYYRVLVIQSDACALLDGNTALGKILATQANGIACITVGIAGDSAGSQ